MKTAALSGPEPEAKIGPLKRVAPSIVALLGLCVSAAHLPALPGDQSRTMTMSDLTIGDVTLTFDLILGTGPDPENVFGFPYAAAVDGNGRIYVSDRKNRRVQVFDAQGHYLSTIGGRNRSVVRLNRPKTVSVDAAGRIHIGDFSGNRYWLVTVGPELELIERTAFRYAVNQIGFDGDRLLLGTKDRRSLANVFIVDRTGYRLGSCDSFSRDVDLWKTRTNMAQAPDGRILLGYEFTPLVRIYEPDGRLVSEFTYAPATKNYAAPKSYLTFRLRDDGVSRPLCYDIAMDSRGWLYLLVSTDFRVNESCSLYRFDPRGTLDAAVELPILCSRLTIDGNDNFYFLSQMSTGYLYRYNTQKGASGTNGRH